MAGSANAFAEATCLTGLRPVSSSSLQSGSCPRFRGEVRPYQEHTSHRNRAIMVQMVHLFVLLLKPGSLRAESHNPSLAPRSGTWQGAIRLAWPSGVRGSWRLFQKQKESASKHTKEQNATVRESGAQTCASRPSAPGSGIARPEHAEKATVTTCETSWNNYHS